MENTALSPETQAVFDAFTEDNALHNWSQNRYKTTALAAALRALAHHWRKENSDEYRTPFIQGMDSCAEEADEIATELEAL